MDTRRIATLAFISFAAVHLQSALTSSAVGTSAPFHVFLPDMISPDLHASGGGGMNNPFVHSIQDIVTIYNDIAGDPHFEAGRVGIEVGQRSMAFLGGLNANAIFILFEITNRSDSLPEGPFTLEDAYVGFNGVMDLGWESGDDMSSLLDSIQVCGRGSVGLNTAVIWDSNFNEGNFQGKVGFGGTTFLQPPGDPWDGIDNDGDGLVDESPFDGIDTELIATILGAKDLYDAGFEWDADFFEMVGTVDLEDTRDPVDEYTASTTDIDSVPVARCTIHYRVDGGPYQEVLMEREAHRFFSGGIPGQAFWSDVSYYLQAVDSAYQTVRDPFDAPITAYEFSVMDVAAFGASPCERCGDGLPRAMALDQNYPNPFNPQTTISFDIPGPPGEAREVSLVIYDMRGRAVRELIDCSLEPGRYRLVWDGANERGGRVSSGLYLCRLRSGGVNLVRKMIVLR